MCTDKQYISYDYCKRPLHTLSNILSDYHPDQISYSRLLDFSRYSEGINQVISYSIDTFDDRLFFGRPNKKFVVQGAARAVTNHACRRMKESHKRRARTPRQRRVHSRPAASRSVNIKNADECIQLYPYTADVKSTSRVRIDCNKRRRGTRDNALKPVHFTRRCIMQFLPPSAPARPSKYVPLRPYEMPFADCRYGSAMAIPRRALSRLLRDG